MPRLKAIEILYHDSGVLVVNKPAGLLSIPGRNVDEPSVMQILQEGSKHVLPVHRLDRGTSGALLFALDADAHRHLSEQFMHRTIRKLYLALVTGRPALESFEIDLPMEQDNRNLMRISSHGKQAITRFRVRDFFARFSLLEAFPVTGRQHQIRVHLAACRHPLVVDPDYGSATPLTISQIKINVRSVQNRGNPALMSRTPLHACEIEFGHPATGERIRVEAPLPKDFRATLNQLDKWGR